MYYLALAAVSVVAYIIGSLNSAIISVYLIKKCDIRQYGSNNAGLTNVYRCFGAGCAAVTLVIDLAKGFAVVFGTRLAFFWSGMFSAEEYNPVTACLIASLFAVMGHVFPVFYRFKGGKGILVAACCALAIYPVIFLWGVIVMAAVVGITRYISLGSICCCIGYPAFIYFAELLNGSIGDSTWLHMLLAGIIGLLCLLRHISNIKRLVEHTERKFTLKKEGEE